MPPESRPPLASPHQYIDRVTGEIRNETLLADRAIGLLYSRLREQAPAVFRALTGKRFSSLLAWLQYDCKRPGRRLRGIELFQSMGIDWRECLHPPDTFTSPRQVFERQIRYWGCRPMVAQAQAVLSPADARMVFGRLTDDAALFIKEKFFTPGELLGPDNPWHEAFTGGWFAIFRLTPDKYHYNHMPVSGVIIDHYTLDGAYHSCNPQAVLALASLHAKNRRVVTIIDTDVAGGSGVGLVAMIEVVALMIGDIIQCYSGQRYDNPTQLYRGLRVEQGQPKSLYRPGSSTDILLVQKDTVAFCPDLVRNACRRDVSSRFSVGLGQPLVETEVRVRSVVATKLAVTAETALAVDWGK